LQKKKGRKLRKNPTYSDISKVLGASEKNIYFYSTLKRSTENKLTPKKIDRNLTKQLFIKNQLMKIV
tara:strand:+ start:315 stop:515 length:201 start_codon:yes stop_codon:yes gene_type:complete